MDHPINLEKPWQNRFEPTVSKLDVFYFFRHILGRLPSEHEWPGHCGAFIGKELSTAVAVYLNSPEFKARRLVQYSLNDVEFIDLDGYGMYISKNDLAVGVHVRETKNYEPKITEIFRQHLQTGMRVIDVGANIGWFSCLASKLVGASGLVVAVEPGTLNGKLLAMSRMVNGWSHLQLVHAAASDTLETLIYSSQSSNGIVCSPASIEDILGSDLVFGVSIDKVIDDGKAWHLIKIDVEGYEYKVLQGAANLIQRCHPWLLIEFCPPAIKNISGIDGETFLKEIIAWSYELTAITSEEVIPCGILSNQVINCYEKSKSDHIDLLATPTRL